MSSRQRFVFTEVFLIIQPILCFLEFEAISILTSWLRDIYLPIVCECVLFCEIWLTVLSSTFLLFSEEHQDDRRMCWWASVVYPLHFYTWHLCAVLITCQTAQIIAFILLWKYSNKLHYNSSFGIFIKSFILMKIPKAHGCISD